MNKQDDYIRTALRLPPELHKAMHEAAKADERTFNGQIVAVLRQSVAAKVAHQAQPQGAQQ